MLPKSTGDEPAPLTASPISKLPYDVLREIFVHCLPGYLDVDDSIATNAPLVLCWVCSAWRTVALSSPTLWTHVYFDCYAERAYDEKFDEKWVILTRSLELIRWWRQNLRSISPFNDMVVHDSTTISYELRSRVPSSEDSVEEVLTFLNSAQYLRTTDLFWWKKMEHKNMNFPNLHTLVLYADVECIDYVFAKVQAVLSNIPRHSLPPLRRLYMEGGPLDKNTPCSPYAWSTLTHISLISVSMSISFWYSLVLCVPNLEWGYLDCTNLDDDDVTTPTACTLLKLTTLFLECYISDIPALRRILRCTPNLTTLYLGRDFLSMDRNNVHKLEILGISSADMAPFWMDVRHLAHLHLGLPRWIFMALTVDETEKRLDFIIRNHFFHLDNKWLGLKNPTCPIHTITIFDEKMDDLRDFITSKIPKIVENSTNVQVQFTAESIMHEDSEVWVKWGARR